MFDVIIGNPPYQRDDGGYGNSSTPLYHNFIFNGKHTKFRCRLLIMIIPARWYTGGKYLDDFRNQMLNCNKIVELHDFIDETEVFNNVEIQGGICYFLYDNDYSGKCKFVEHNKFTGKHISYRELNFRGRLIRDNIVLNILNKIIDKEFKSFSNIVYPRNIFNIPTDYNGIAGDCKVICKQHDIKFIAKESCKDTHNLRLYYNVIMSRFITGTCKPNSQGKNKVISDSIYVLNPGDVCTDTYLCIGRFNSLDEANNVISYIKTKFFRILLLQNLSSVGISNTKFELIPMQDFSKPWTDEELYIRYNLTQQEITYIEDRITEFN